MDYLNRHYAPLPEAIWNDLDEATVEAARASLTARRFLDVDGPYGAGFTALTSGDEDGLTNSEAAAGDTYIAATLPVPLLRQPFALSVRRLVAQFEQLQPRDLGPAEAAAATLARREDQLIYQGDTRAGLPGLLTVEGRHDIAITDWWQDSGQTLEDVLSAVDRLDNAGFAGPYALVLAPKLYNSLFRRYDNTPMMRFEHLRKLCRGGLFKAPIETGLLLDQRAAQLLIGMDLSVGYSHGDGAFHHFFLSESLVLRIDEPSAICTFSVGGK